jgi:hypothetical protein
MMIAFLIVGAACYVGLAIVLRNRFGRDHRPKD